VLSVQRQPVSARGRQGPGTHPCAASVSNQLGWPYRHAILADRASGCLEGPAFDRRDAVDLTCRRMPGFVDDGRSGLIVMAADDPVFAAFMNNVGATDKKVVNPADALHILILVGQGMQDVAHRVEPGALLVI